MAGTLLPKLSLFLGITLPMVAASRILCPMNCHCLSYDTFTCYLQTPVDYKAFAQMNDKTLALRLVIKGTFREDLADFNNLCRLQKLEMTADRHYLSYQEAVQDKAVNTFIRHDLFQNVTDLRSLSISLVLKSFSSALLATFRQLKALRSFYTYMFDFNDFVNIVSATGTHLLRVEDFRMIAVQRVITPNTTIRLKEHIYERLQNLTLKVLDLSNNKAVLVQQGLARYLPHLEVFRVGALEFMIFEGTHYSRICNLAGVLMHANLREFEFSFPRKRTIKSAYIEGYASLSTDNRLLYCIQHMNISTDLCSFVNCICKGLTILPCPSYGKEIHMKDLIIPPEGDQPMGICIPPPPSLETFVYRNYPSVVITQEINFCFNPSNWSNILKYVDVSSNDLKFQLSPTFSITGLRKLSFFNFQGNGIVFSNRTKMFADMPSLEVLLLANNNISIISHRDIDFLQLTVLDLENCGIHGMPGNSLQLLRKLQMLNLSRNTLTEFDINITNLTHLKLLNLSNNDISTLGKDLRRQLDALHTTLDISGNPLTCYCNNIDFVQWLKTTRFTRFVRKNATKCSHPTLPVVSPWDVDVNALYRECIHFDAIMSSVGSALGMTLVITAILVLYKRRWRIRYWLYATKESWRQRRDQGERTPLLTKDYTYDAFVAYSSHGAERAWVHTTLREKLENEHGLKLCMYHRDFKVGRDLAETIVKGINSSNKTLLILSPNFLNSGWCEFEDRMANDKVISERQDSMVIVIFRRLDKAGTKLPKMLTRLMEKKIYIEWTDDPDGLLFSGEGWWAH